MIKSIRAIGRFFGKFLDAEDRQAIGTLLVLVGSGALIVVTAGGALGLAWRLFEIAKG